jgi:c-di-AMP phosphodiesterase-like protein
MQTIVAQAADELLSVRDVDASFVLFCENGGVNISARSFGAVNVQLVMEALGGGGHQTMAGTFLKDITMDEAKERLRYALDVYKREQNKKTQ